MSNSARDSRLRPEFRQALEVAHGRMNALLKGSAFSLAKGTMLIEAGSHPDFVYRLKAGWMGSSRTTADGRRQFNHFLLPGDLFPVSSLFAGAHHDAVQSVTSVVVERINRDELYAVCVEDNNVAAQCTWQLLEEARRLRTWALGLGTGVAEERLALLLLDLRVRLSLPGTLGLLLSYPLPLTQLQLADHLGITAVHVNRVLKSFRERNIAIVYDGSVHILDLELLSRLAAPLCDSHHEYSPTNVKGNTTIGVERAVRIEALARPDPSRSRASSF